MWVDNKTGKEYEVVSENARMKLPSEEWFECVLYKPVDGDTEEVLIMGKDAFYEGFIDVKQGVLNTVQCLESDKPVAINGRIYVLRRRFNNSAPCSKCAFFKIGELTCGFPEGYEKRCVIDKGTRKGWNTVEYSVG